VNATLMGLAFMSLFISNKLIGFSSLATRHPSLPIEFWAMHAAIAAARATRREVSMIFP